NWRRRPILAHRAISGELRHLAGNDPLRIDGQTAWVVESGSIALFAIDSEPANSADGNRDFMMRLDAGEALMAGLSPKFADFHVLAVAINKADVRPLAAGVLIDAAREGNPSAVQRLEKWASRIALSLKCSEWKTSADVVTALAAAEKDWLNAFEAERIQKRQEAHSRFLKKQAVMENVAREALDELADVLKSAKRSILPADGSLLLR